MKAMNKAKLCMSMAVLALLYGKEALTVEIQEPEDAQGLEDASFLQIDAAFDDAFEISKDGGPEEPSSASFLQVGG